ncbi:MAG TPA: hypothetical protein VFG89_00015 [Coriobacteriia bacterium]|nr:hypothetical protein [Coriobacteriia bacterium]
MAQRAAAHPATLTAVFGLILGVIVALKAPLALAAGAAALGLAIALRRRFELALSLMCWGVVKYSVMGQLGAIAGVIPYAELALVVMVAALALLDEPADSWLARSRVWRIMPVFALLVFGSWALNGGSLLALGAGYRSLLTMPLLALTLARSMRTREQFDALYKAGILFTWLQVPVALYQFAFLGGSSSNVDVVAGTLGLGGSNVLGVWMLGATLAALWSYLHKPRAAAAISGIAFAVTMVFSSARLALYAAPFVLVVALVQYQRQKNAVGHRTLVVALAGVLVFAVAVLGTYSAYSSSGMRDAGASDINVASLVAAQSDVSGYGVPRFAYLQYSWDYIRNASSFWLVGTGPATGGSGAASLMNDAGSSQFQTGFRLISLGRGAETGSVHYFVNMPQAMATIVESGPLGYLLMLSLYGAVGVMTYRRLRRTEADATGYTALAPAAALVFVAFVTLGTVYSVVWEGLSITGLCFWWFALMSASGRFAEGEPAEADILAVDA